LAIRNVSRSGTNGANEMDRREPLLLDQSRSSGAVCVRGARWSFRIHRPHAVASFARAGVASVVAISHELAERFPEVRKDVAAKQFCGALVADLMRTSGHDVVQARGRADGVVFTYGAVFTAFPTSRDYSALVSLLSCFPQRVRSLIQNAPERIWTTRPERTGFSLVEHVCNLRDLDAVYAKRIRSVLDKPLPRLPSVDGTALAQARQYSSESLTDAFREYEKARRKLAGILKGLSTSRRKRCGLRDGLQRVNIDDLVREIAEHDSTHQLEMEELQEEIDLGSES